MVPVSSNEVIVRWSTVVSKSVCGPVTYMVRLLDVDNNDTLVGQHLINVTVDGRSLDLMLLYLVRVTYELVHVLCDQYGAEFKAGPLSCVTWLAGFFGQSSDMFTCWCGRACHTQARTNRQTLFSPFPV